MLGRTNTGGGGVGGTLTVTAPAGVAVTVSKDGKTKTKVANTEGIAVFKGLTTGTWIVTITSGEKTASKSTVVTTDYGIVVSLSTIPDFTYTGNYQIVDDDDNEITETQGNWKIRLLTSGTLNFTDLNGAENGIDVFCVGGGGGGYGIKDSYNVWSGAGGGGGYTKTKKNVSVTKDEEYKIVVGAGGSGSYDSNSVDGGKTTAFGVTAAGGKGTVETQSAATGGSGGSGGAGAAGIKNGSMGYGGEDGEDGTTTNSPYTGGSGQGTTTREFGEEDGNLYASGGDSVSANGESGGANTGDGGSGSRNTAGGDGGSGIVVIRNKRG